MVLAPIRATSAAPGTAPLVEPGGHCIDVSGGAAVDGSSVVAATCNGAASQSGPSRATALSKLSEGKCLTVSPDGTSLQI